MLPGEMEDPTKGNGGAKGGKEGEDPKKPPQVDPNTLPMDEKELLRITTVEQMNMMWDLVYEMGRISRKVREGPGDNDKGESDGESSDSQDLFGRPKPHSPRRKQKIRRAMKRISPPIFRGDPGERPEAHLLRTLDWYDAIGITADKSKMDNFRHTLDQGAREWFADLWSRRGGILGWEELTNEFSRYFSTQGRSLTHLHNAWKSFTFDPQMMDIEDFIRDVQECGTQLKYGEHSIMDMIKSCMPRENYGTLYKMDTLTEVITFCKNAYAVTPAKRAKKGCTQVNATTTGTSPLSTIKSSSAPDLSQHLNKLTDTLNKLDFKQKPYKPQIYP